MGPAEAHYRRRADLTSDAADLLAVCGLLHDVGHQVTTLSYLVEAARGEVGLPGNARLRVEILAQEISRLRDIVGCEVPGGPFAAEACTVDLRSLARQRVQVAGVTHCARVVLLPGPDMSLEADPTLLCRVLINVVENAARATGPGGSVEVGLRDQRGAIAIIDVVDDGPGFGPGAPGAASMGLSVVTSLLDSCGGSLEVRPRRAGGHGSASGCQRRAAAGARGHRGAS